MSVGKGDTTWGFDMLHWLKGREIVVYGNHHTVLRGKIAIIVGRRNTVVSSVRLISYDKTRQWSVGNGGLLP